MKKWMLWGWLCWSVGLAQAQVLSDRAQISLLTYDPIEEMYGSYGHSAFRVSDPMNGIDKIYNYGTFDFDTPGFYRKFIQGKLNYKLSTVDYRTFERLNDYYPKTIYQENLMLSAAEKQALFAKLETNALPENAYYLYDFFFDNCATRLRDLVDEACGDSIVWAEAEAMGEPLSFRALQKQYLGGKPWTDFGIDFILGARADRIATPAERMYIPMELQKSFRAAQVRRGDTLLPLLDRGFYLEQTAPLVLETAWWQRPLTVMWAVLVIVLLLTFWGYRTGRAMRWLDATWLTVYGLGGLFVLLMWIATDHSVTTHNWNLLWLHPGFLVLLAAMWSHKARASWLPWLWAAVAVAALVALGFGALLPQEFHPAFTPLMLLVVVRAWMARRLA